jgi:putative aminopeptidase FrvX
MKAPSLVLVALTMAASVSAQDTSRVAEAQSVLAPLIESYGVSGMETAVRATVQKLLPAWAKTETDTASNLWVRVGQGDPVIVFVAHLDEIGYRVDSILDDGSLRLLNQGGFFQSLFEAEPALVHTPKGDVPAVFLPRDTGTTHHNPPPVRASVGTTSRQGTLALGVTVGSTLTMPKQFTRLAGTRATGRAMDDRVGDAAQILALRHLDRGKLRHQVIFLFSTREEIGLDGARAAANALGTTPRRVHAIDTFVSADSPLELQTFATAKLGDGPVARSLDNSSVTPAAYVDSLVQVARARGVPLQVGTTNGGNDGSTFTPFGVVDVAMGWPLRYSHSPAEVVDLRDVAALADLVQAIAEIW